MPPKKAAASSSSTATAASASTSADKPAKKVSEDEVEPVILEYLIKQNRPYNATDLQANLKSKHNISKPAVVKALGALAERGEITEKTYGKQLIYSCKQPEETVNAEDLESLRNEIKETKTTLAGLKEELKIVQSETAALESAPSTGELPKLIAELSAEVEKQATHHASLTANPSMMLDKADIARIDNTFDKVRKLWLARRKAGEEICNLAADTKQTLSKAAAREWLVEDMWIEFDEQRLDDLKKGPMGKGVKRKL